MVISSFFKSNCALEERHALDYHTISKNLIQYCTSSDCLLWTSFEVVRSTRTVFVLYPVLLMSLLVDTDLTIDISCNHGLWPTYSLRSEPVAHKTIIITDERSTLASRCARTNVGLTLSSCLRGRGLDLPLNPTQASRAAPSTWNWSFRFDDPPPMRVGCLRWCTHFERDS
jgi:hypothetical protein